MLAEKKYLGFSEENIKRGNKYLGDNLASYELHVIKNHIVSLPYFYWYDGINNDIYVDRERRNKLDIDKRERNGLYEYGIRDSMNLAMKNPGKITYLYSPPGPASFDPDPPLEYKKPYDIGQLYLMWFDGKKINNIAVSINENGEDWLKEIFSQEYLDFIKEIQDIREKIAFYITTPHLSLLSIYDFLKNDWKYRGIVFKSNNLDGKKEFKVTDVINELTKSLRGELRTEFNREALEKMVSDGLSTEKIYKTVISRLMQTRGLTRTTLGGGCGGEDVEIDNLLSKTDLSSLFTEKLFKTQNLSSKYRLINQKDDNNENNTYPCPHCTKPIPYEEDTQQKAKWRTKCPHCGGSLTGQCQ